MSHAPGAAHSSHSSVYSDSMLEHLPAARVAMEVFLVNSSKLAENDISSSSDALEAVFADGVYSLDSLSLHYKLFVPDRVSDDPAPLLLMLHGCGQDAQDFSTGTQMNAIAQAAGMYVIYPTQSSSANANSCWNWFVPKHQIRDSGEPAALSALTRQIMDSHPIDPKLVFVAGLSAGGAMALIMAEQYPELYAAVGVHSGLPSGAATSMMEAFNLMRKSAAGKSMFSGSPGGAAASRASSDAVQADETPEMLAEEASYHTPLIVFHGDQDRTVYCANADRIVDNWLEKQTARSGAANWQTTSLTHATDTGRQSVVTTYAAEVMPERAACEYWRLIDGGHNWSGGNSDGSYTDAQGPDASVEMVRFFLERTAA